MKAFDETFKKNAYDFHRSLQIGFDGLKPLKPVKELLYRERLQSEGWVCHCSMADLPEEFLDSKNISTDLLNYFRINWEKVRAGIEARLESYPVDSETRLTFREVLDAHGRGSFRCSARTLFPEIERVARYLFTASNPFKSFAKLREVINKAGEMSMADIKPHGIYAFMVFCLLEDISYERVDTETYEKLIKIPNRHAAVHGFIPYYSEQHSLNAIFLTDHILQIMAVIKHLSETPH